jgi:hypothetical protein
LHIPLQEVVRILKMNEVKWLLYLWKSVLVCSLK